MDTSEPPDQKSSRLRWPAILTIVLLLILAAGISIRHSLVQSCDVDAVQHASIVLLRQMDRYDHSYQFATSASQDAIVRPVGELQQLLMDTQDVTVPACLETAKAELVHYMSAVMQAFVAYGAQETNTTVRELIDKSEMHYDNFRAELEAVNQCAPLCLR